VLLGEKNPALIWVFAAYFQNQLNRFIVALLPVALLPYVQCRA